MKINQGSSAPSVQVEFVDDSGLALTGKVAADFPFMAYQKSGANGTVAVSLSNLAALTTPYASGGVKEIGGGKYRLDLPLAAVTTPTRLAIIGDASNKHVIAPPIDVEPNGLLDQSIEGSINTVLGANTYGVTFENFDANVFDDAFPVFLRAVDGLATGEETYGTITAGQLTTIRSLALAGGDTIRLSPYAGTIPSDTGGSGGGDTDVDHNYPSADSLRYTYGSGANMVGIDNATVRAYTLADYAAGNRTLPYVEGQATTGIVGGVSGRWTTPIRLTSNGGSNSYVIEFTGGSDGTRQYQTVTNALSL